MAGFGPMEAPRSTRDRARRLRRRLDLPEVLLWDALRGRRLEGLRFRRQHPIGPYCLDFYCEAARLAVEVDGYSHDVGDRPERDLRRDAWVAEQGVRTLRIPARDVLDDLDTVLTAILASAREPF
ncbi:MAG: endonuclease domain-containing protein [Caulobacteraceae bacterium]|nr:endonuclease domain-containing protein [Caulobacteraceae bacterium]